MDDETLRLKREVVNYKVQAFMRGAMMAQAKQARSKKAIVSAQNPRTGKPMRAAIIRVMKPFKRRGDEFKAFMKAWETDAIDGLRLAELAPLKYSISDENGELGNVEHKNSYLSNLYSEAKPTR